MTKTATRTLGWGVSLLFRGRSVAECSVRDGTPLRLGEDPACTLVVPGLGGSAPLTRDEHLLGVPGITGLVHRDGGPKPIDPTGAMQLAVGERAELHLVAHPEITLELRRQQFERLPLGTLLNVRELGRQLALGAGLVAGMILLVRSEAPVNTLAVKGEPDAPEDSALVRAMFATTVEPPPIVDVRWLAAPAPVAPPSPEFSAPVSSLAAPDPPPVAVPVADAPPRAHKRRAFEPESMALLGSLESDELGGLFDEAVGGGVVGGVVGGTVAHDVMAERRPDAPALAFGLADVGAGGLGGGGTGEGVRVGEELVVRELRDQPRPELNTLDILEGADDSFVEAIMGPGTSDTPVPGDSPPPPPQAGPHSHSEAGVAVLRGTADGLAAIAPEDRCDDPSISKKRQLDVVFVVDVSTTMNFMLGRIEKQLARVDTEARAAGLDTRYGLVVFVDDVQLGNQGQPYVDLAAVQRDLAHWQAFTGSNRQIGSEAANLDWPENSLDALHSAATGFAWRPADTTLRMIVHATDDDFGEAPAVQSGQPIQHSYLETVAALRAAEVRVFSFAAKIGGQCECLDVRPGLFTRHRGRPSLPSATGGAVFDIDEVASDKLSFAAAVGGAIKSGVCTRYPLSPFG
jgi:hypothetical protein